MSTVFLLLCAIFPLAGALDSELNITTGNTVYLDEDNSLPLGIVEASPALDTVNVQGWKIRVQKGEEAMRPELLSKSVQGRVICPSGWSPYGTRCFIFINSPSTWAAAESHCLHFGANLASVHSFAEYHFIQEVVRQGSGGFPHAWIGGTDAVKNRLWFWSDGSRFDFRIWHHGEPNNNNNAREPCIEMNFGAEHRWNDVRCDDIQAFVCAKRMNC